MAFTKRAKRRLTLLLGVLGLVAVLGVGAWGARRWWLAHRAADARAQGWKYYDAGDYANALGPLSAYVGAGNQSDVDALLRLAKSRYEVPALNRKNIVDAARFYSTALAQRPGDVAALIGLVNCYRELGYTVELEKAVTALLGIEPKNIAAIQAQLLLERSRGEWEKAVKSAQLLVECEPNSYLWRVLLLDVIRASGVDVAKRIEVVRTWIAAGESDGRYRLFLADLLRLNGQLPDAKKEATAAATLGMPDTTTLGVLIDLLDKLQLPDVAMNAVRLAREKGLDPVALVNMQVQRHWLAGRLDDARKELDSFVADQSAAAPVATKQRSELFRWRVKVAEALLDIAASDAAIAALREAISGDVSLGPKSASWIDAVVATRGAQAGSANVKATTSSLRDGAVKLDAARAAENDDSFLLLRAGDLATRMGEADEAVRYYRKAYDRESGRWGLAGVRLTHAMLNVGRTEEAFRLANELAQRFQQSPSVLFVLAEACNSLAREGRTPALVDPTVGNLSASAILQALYTALNDDETFLAPLVSAKIADRDEASGTALARKAIDDPKTSAAVLLQLAGIVSEQRFGDLPTRALAAARSRGANPTDATVLECRLAIARGDAEGARQRAEAEFGTATEPARAIFARVLAEAAVAANADDVAAVLSQYLKEGGDDPDAASFVLGQVSAWEDEALVTAAIERLRTIAGEGSSRFVLSDAARVLLFHRNDQKKISTVVIAVNELLNSNPESTAALVSMSRLLAAKQPPDVPAAAKFLERAIALQPGRRDLYPELVGLFQSTGDFANANRYLQQYMRSAEQSDDDSRRGVRLLVAQGDFAAALPALERIARSTKVEADLVALADVKRRAGFPDEAERILKEATSKPGRTILAVMSYSDFLARRGRLAEAKALVNGDAETATPALTPANRAFVLARLEIDYGDPKLAGPAIEESIRLAPDAPSVALLAARHQLALGNLTAAIAVARASLAKNPNDESLLQFVSSMMLADPASRAEVEKALDALKATNPALRELLLVVRASEGPNGAINPGPNELKTIVDLTERYSGFAPIWTAAIELHTAAGKTDDAIRIARRAMTRLPSEAGPPQLAAQLLLQARRLDECREAARAWRTLTADSPLEADLLLARAALLSGKPGEAASLLKPYADRLSLESTTRPAALGVYAVAQLLDGKTDAAFASVRNHLAEGALRAEWLRAIRAAPTPLAMDALVRTQAVIATAPSGASSLSNESLDENRVALLAEYVALAGRSDGKAAIDRATLLFAALGPVAREATVTKLLAADLAGARGDAPAASAAYEAIWMSVPEAERTKLLGWQSLDEPTRTSMQGVRSLAVYTANNQVSVLARAGIDLDKALAIIDRAIVLEPSNAALQDTKATVLLARKEYDQARSVALGAVKMPGASASISLTLARIELAAGRLEDARRYLQTAQRELASDPFADRTTLDQLAQVTKAIEAAALRKTT